MFRKAFMSMFLQAIAAVYAFYSIRAIRYWLQVCALSLVP
ncbi:hypothetical protein PCH70_30770 [Pseudomonas cichorii JBC1]|nr:hypothetical protein PCH70_30770 [Pseudomonas cichorii JBC1]